MSINGANVRRLYESKGPVEFADWFSRALGLPGTNTGMRRCVDDFGHVVLESDRTIRPESVPIRELALALLGPWEEDARRSLWLGAQQPHMVPVLEAGSEITPSQFANISAFNSSMIGLLEVKMLEAYSRPKFMVSQLFEQVGPTNLRSLKYIGISNIGDVAQVRKPGQPHVRAQLSERYVTTPDTVDRGIAIEVSAEAVLYDTSRDLLKQAETVGESLALRKEYLCVDVAIGVTNTYTYDGTVYNTYVTGGGNWVNSFSNPVPSTSAAWSAFNQSIQKFVGLTDPETGEPIDIEEYDILAMPGNHFTMSNALMAESIWTLTGPAAATGTYATANQIAPNPIKGMFNLLGGPQSLRYPYALKRATAADGLNLSNTDATSRWWVGDFQKAFGWHSNLPLTTIRAAATDYIMADRRLILAIFCDEIGIPFVKEPRCVQVNTA